MRMRISDKLVTAIVLSTFLSVPVKADTWHATGQTSTAICANLGYCANLSYDLLITTDPLVTFVIGPGPGQEALELIYPITGISGQIGGYSTTAVPNLQGALLVSHGNARYDNPVPDSLIAITANGYSGYIGGGSEFVIPADNADYSHTVEMVIRAPQGIITWCTWNIVNVPEPSTLVLVSGGLLLAALVMAMKRKLSAGRWAHGESECE